MDAFLDGRVIIIFATTGSMRVAASVVPVAHGSR